MLPGIWKTLFLPKNFPPNQVLHNYVFGYNETHTALALDYGSVFNHHESANANAVRFLHLSPGIDLQFRVRTGFVCGNRNVPKSAVYMHASAHRE